MVTNWNSPMNTLQGPEEAVRWWLGEHFVPASEWEVGIGAIFLYASYCDAVVATGLPLITGSMFGRIMGGLVPRKRGGSGSTGGSTTYQLRARAAVKLAEVPFEDNMKGGGLMRKIWLETCRKTGAKPERTWEEFAEERRRDEAIVSRHIVDKHGLRPILAPGRKAASIDDPVDEGHLVTIPVQELWGDFPKLGWTYVKFLGVLGQVTQVSRNSRIKFAYMEKP